MSHRIPFLVPLAALLAGCPSPVEPVPIRFADATPMMREAAIHAAANTGSALGTAALVALEQDALADDGCVDAQLLAPRPPEVLVTADMCTGASDTSWDGTVVAENSPLVAGLLEELGADLVEGRERLDFRQLFVDGLAFDGTVERTGTRTIVDLAVTDGTAGYSTHATFDCEDTFCEVEPGAYGVTPELGAFDFRGGFGPDGGQLVLQGHDEMTVDFDDLDPEGCAAVLIEGEEVQRFCFQDEAPTAHELVSGGFGCSDDTWFLDATVVGDDVAELRATLYFDDGSEAHPLAFVQSYDEGDLYQVELEIGAAYVAGQSSAIACASDDKGITSADLLVEAVATDGEVLACLTAGQGGRVPAVFCPQ